MKLERIELIKVREGKTSKLHSFTRRMALSSELLVPDRFQAWWRIYKCRRHSSGPQRFYNLKRKKVKDSKYLHIKAVITEHVAKLGREAQKRLEGW